MKLIITENPILHKYVHIGSVLSVPAISQPNIAPRNQHRIKTMGIKGMRKNKNTIQHKTAAGKDENKPPASEKAKNFKNLTLFSFMEFLY